MRQELFVVLVIRPTDALCLRPSRQKLAGKRADGSLSAGGKLVLKRPNLFRRQHHVDFRVSLHERDGIRTSEHRQSPLRLLRTSEYTNIVTRLRQLIVTDGHLTHAKAVDCEVGAMVAEAHSAACVRNILSSGAA